MSARFPGIPATNDLPTCRVLSFHTIGYVQALCFHCLTYMSPKKALKSRASAFCRTFVEDITAEGREEENYENLRKRLCEFHCTMLGVDGASGETGDRKLSSKRKSRSLEAPPALGDAEQPHGEEPPTTTEAPPAPADGAGGAAEAPPTPPQASSKRASRR